MFDDFAPAQTAQKKAQMMNNLELVIRMIGDGATKGRSNAMLEDKKGDGVQGTVVITGELKGTGTSSNLRCLYLQIQPGDIDSEKLAFFQRNPHLYSESLNRFAEFVGKEWAEIVAYVKAEYPKRRLELEGEITERRLVDTEIFLDLVTDILENFLISLCGMDRPSVNIAFQEIRVEIHRCVKRNFAMIRTEDYPTLFLRSVHHLICNNEISISKQRLTLETLSEYQGFESGGDLFLSAEKIFPKVKAFLAKLDIDLPFSYSEMIRQQAEAGIIKKASNGNRKFVNFSRVDVGDRTKHNFTQISSDKFYKIVE